MKNVSCMSIKELERRIDNESVNRETLDSCNIVDILERIKNGTDLRKAKERLMYLKGVLNGLLFADFINPQEYTDLLHEVNIVYSKCKERIIKK